MRDEYRDALIRCETNVDAALNRLSGNEDIYETCLTMFLQDQSMPELFRAIETSSWDEAFTAVHALKGVAGNMGFIPLFHAAAEMVVLIRSGRMSEFEASCQQLKRCYDEISTVILKYNKKQDTN